MMQIKRKSFILNTESTEDALDTLLRLNSHTRMSFSVYMGIELDELNKAPKWALNYLSDLTDSILVHLGYVMKDARHEGALGEYREEVATYELLLQQNSEMQQPIIINEDVILSANGTLRVSFLSNIFNELKIYNNSFKS